MTDQWKWNNCVIMKKKLKTNIEFPQRDYRNGITNGQRPILLLFSLKIVISSGKINMKS